MNNQNNISETLETIFWVTIIKFFDADPDPGSGIFLTLDLVSGINITDPQHCLIRIVSYQAYFLYILVSFSVFEWEGKTEFMRANFLPPVTFKKS